MCEKREILSNKLNRYTSLPALRDILRTGELTLKDPSGWEDKNDTRLLQRYMEVNSIDRLFAICFATGDETVHHWNRYAHGPNGCCIEFDRKRLLSSIPPDKFLVGDVTYKTINAVKKERPPLERFPFTKRWPYRFEEEFRILFKGKSGDRQVRVSVQLSAIRRITLSPEVSEKVRARIEQQARSATRNPNLSVKRSTVYENHEWISQFVS
ncbi:MAG: hypothetical protein ACM3NO_11215 [Deltaproteobacteria bacterium]